MIGYNIIYWISWKARVESDEGVNGDEWINKTGYTGSDIKRRGRMIGCEVGYEDDQIKPTMCGVTLYPGGGRWTVGISRSVGDG